MGRGFEGRAAAQRGEERGTWELHHSYFLAKSTFLSKLQTAALSTLSYDLSAFSFFFPLSGVGGLGGSLVMQGHGEV